MDKNDIDEILLINCYLVKNKMLYNHEKVNLLRKYLTNKIKKLIEKNRVIELSN
jgi:hypothetical protein